MGMGSLKRIAALTALATCSVMVTGAVEVGALPGVPTVPEVNVPSTTVPSTTTTVPSTPVTPTTTVTTPTVTTPTVTTPDAPPPPPKPGVAVPKAPAPSTPKLPAGSGSPEKAVSNLTSPAGGGSGTGGGSGGGGSVVRVPSSPTAAVERLTGSGTSAPTSGAIGGATAGGGATNPALQALAFFDGPGGPGGTGAGGAGSGVFGGGGAAGGGGGGRLPANLSVAAARQLRSALELLEGCMSAIAPLDRQVLGMRAGSGGAGPLSRTQVAARLGLSPREVRFSERRGLSGLRTAAQQTGCAGPVGGPFAPSGIGPLPLAAAAMTPALASPGAAASGGGNAYVPARQAEPGAESPLAGLSGSGQSGPAWLVVLFTVLFSVSIAGLMRELRSSIGA